MRLIVTTLFILAAFAHSAAQDWKLKKEGKNLKVYTAEKAGSAFKSVRVECLVRGRSSQVVAVLFDLEQQKEWVFNDKYSYLLKQPKPNELFYYSEVSVPWPGTNRDFIAHMTVTQVAAGVVTIESHAEPDYVPEKDNLVRLKHSNSLWTMTAAGSGQTRIVYEIEFDPGGLVPAWIINMFVTKGPYETFSKLQQRMDMPQYKDANYDFISE